MKKVLLSLTLIILLISCQDEITVILQKEPGSITGQIRPKGIGTVVSLYQGPKISEVNADDEGYFKFSDVSVGTYTLRANAPKYGTQEIRNVQVDDGQGTDLGLLYLYRYPAPLLFASPADGSTNISVTSTRLIIFYFDQMMDLESLRDAFSISPAVAGLSIQAGSQRPPYSSYFDYYVEGTFKSGTQYTFTLDSKAETISGDTMEFSYSSTFETEHFELLEFSPLANLEGNQPLRLRFSNQADALLLSENLTIEPDIKIYVEDLSRFSNNIYVYPILSWIPDTVFTITISSNFHDIDGNTLQNDTSFVVTSQPLKVRSTLPYDNQHFVPTDQIIDIRMNNIVDESTFLDAFSIEPAINWNLITEIYGGMTDFRLVPDSLSSNTLYSVTIDTLLMDYYGKPLGETFTFSFMTK